MSATILPANPENLKAASELLRKNEVVAMPTETVYGLAGNAFSPDALTKIFSVKERPKFDPLIIHVRKPGSLPQGPFPYLAYLEQLQLIDPSRLDETAKQRANDLLTAFWPGPLTVVLPKNPKVPDLATSGLPTVALRVPGHPAAQALLLAAGFPLAAPSANRFGKISPTTAAAVKEELGEKIEMIIDGGPCEIGLESTVVAVEPDGAIRLLRPGMITKSQIEERTGIPAVIETHSVDPDQAADAPGRQKSHYAPTKPFGVLENSVMNCNVVQLTERLKKLVPNVGRYHMRVGLLLMSGDPDMASMYFYGLTGSMVTVRSLSKTGNLEEIAQKLFSELRFLDHSDVHAILAEPCPSQEGLGFAITDRLQRASTT